MNVLHALVQLTSIVSSIGVLVVTCLTVTKAETGGGGSTMGIASLGGRASTPVGSERILKPLMLWCGVTFVFTAVLLALPSDRFALSLGAIPLYVGGMAFRHSLAARIRGWFPNLLGDD